MKKQRYLAIVAATLSAGKVLRNYGRIARIKLPEVTLYEHDWLIRHAPSVAGLTRCPGSPEDWVESTSRPSSARTPALREIWVGSRSMACLGDGDHDASEGLVCSQSEQEAAAELTELQTVLYQDPVRYEKWVKEEIEHLVAQAYELSISLGRKLLPVELNQARLTAEAQVRQESANMGFIDDPETGEYRPIRNGDVIQVMMSASETKHMNGKLVWTAGTTETLDALYLEEPSDPRSEDGAIYRELLRDQIRANSDFEQDLLNDPTMGIPSKDDEFAENDLHLRRVAYYKAERIIARQPNIPAEEIRNESLRRVKAGHSRLGHDATGQATGYFMRPKDIWDENEFQIRRLEESLRHNRIKARPATLDWNVLRSTQSRLMRATEVKTLANQAEQVTNEQNERRRRLIEAKPELAGLLK